MTGVFVKLPEILRYFDGHLDELVAGEPYYYNEWILCTATTKRTLKKIELGLCMVARKEDEESSKPQDPKPHDVPGSLSIADNGELLIDKFTCQTCKKDTCEHVAGVIWFLNRHNINKSEKFKPDEIKDAREMIIEGRYNARPLSSYSHLFSKCHHGGTEENSDDSWEDIEDEENEGEENECFEENGDDEDLGDEELNRMNPKMKESVRVIKKFMAQMNNPLLAPFLMSRLQDMANGAQKKSGTSDEDMEEASSSTQQPSEPEPSTSKCFK